MTRVSERRPFIERTICSLFSSYLDHFIAFMKLVCRTSQIWTSIFAFYKKVWKININYSQIWGLARPPPRWIPSTVPDPPRHPERRNCRKQRGLWWRTEKHRGPRRRPLLPRLGGRKGWSRRRWDRTAGPDSLRGLKKKIVWICFFLWRYFRQMGALIEVQNNYQQWTVSSQRS